MGRKARVVFLHPDLGIGGAERLIVDAGLALKDGFAIRMYTSHHRDEHCFIETKDGTLPRPVVYGDWLPRHLFGRLHALFAYIRMVWLALVVCLATEPADVIICDQVSACIPVLRLLSGARIVFYCHFPDQLLTQRQSLLKRLYRAPLDLLEQLTTGMADVVLVNSAFTRDVFKETFPMLSVVPDVLYPSLNFEAFDAAYAEGTTVPFPPKQFTFLSINRFERKKNLDLALEAFILVRERLAKGQLVAVQGVPQDEVHLVIAGGYDKRVAENVEYCAELKKRCEDEGVSEHVTFLRSFSDDQKLLLLERCCCLVYTPDREHFGITPLEAMYRRRGVIAVNSGGPKESVADGETGFLCAATPDAFATAMEQFVCTPETIARFGEAGRARVVRLFSFAAFSRQLQTVVEAAASTAPFHHGLVLLTASALAAASVAAAVVLL